MSYTTRLGSDFIQDGKKFRFVGANQYGLAVQYMSQANIAYLFDYAKRDGISVFRTWAFDTNAYGPFHQLIYPLTGTNLVTNSSFETDTNGWVLNSDNNYANAFSRSNDIAHTGSWSIKQVSLFNTYQRLSSVVTVTANTDYVLSFWYQLTTTAGNQSQLPPSVRIFTGDGVTQILDGGILSPTTNFVQKQIKFNSGSNTSIQLLILNFGGQSTAYYDDFFLELAPIPVLQTIESGYKQLDMVLDEARKTGIKLILSLMDSNENSYNSKLTYVAWANALNPGANISATWPYTAFFTDPKCQAIYKQNFLDLANRVNTINGRTYKNDDTIFAWELGNEIRLNINDTSGQNTVNGSNLAILSKPGGWADIMSTYIKGVDTNHLVGFGDMGHTWQWFGGDTVSNGTYYGVDYSILSALPNIDYLDFHLYPTQADHNKLQGFGQRLGFSVTPSGAGLTAQLQDYVKVGKKNDKPVVCSEWGLLKEFTPTDQDYPIYPRFLHFRKVFQDFLDYGGDGFMIWSYSASNAGYEMYALGNNGYNSNLNFDDNPMKSLWLEYSKKLFNPDSD